MKVELGVNEGGGFRLESEDNLDIVITYHNCQTYVPVGMTEHFSLMNLILRVSRLTVQLPESMMLTSAY
uniref:Uncharacterized protein n=1 Tax=Glossina palpalis gambiensis TaxID=67801 RepID=A0A1B0C3Q3_9MUSC